MNIRRLRRTGLIVLMALAATAGSCRSSDDEASDTEDFNPVATAVQSCYKPGDRATVVTKNAKGANVAYLVTYADGLPREETPPPKGDANAKGEFHGSWVVPPGVPPGAAKVRIAVAAGQNGKQIEANFTVADASGTCPTPTVTTSAAQATSVTSVPTASTRPGETTIKASTTSTTAAGGSISTTSTTETPVLEGGAFETKVEVLKSCVEPGKPQTIRVQAAKRGALTYVVAYAEGSPRGNSNGGTTDAKGFYEDTFVVDVDARPGRATVQVTVQGQQREGTSWAATRFQVGDC